MTKKRPPLNSFGFLRDSQKFGVVFDAQGIPIRTAGSDGVPLIPPHPTEAYGIGPTRTQAEMMTPVVIRGQSDRVETFPVEDVYGPPSSPADALGKFEHLTQNTVVPLWGFACARCKAERVFEENTIGFLCLFELWDAKVMQ